MAFQHKNGRGSAFPNERKREGRKDADYTGSARVNDEDYWLDIWQDEGRLSVQLRKKSTVAQQSAPPPPAFDDELPNW